jgi:divalent metal cation (Fe/Co/Zn/Cd) transporter
MSGIFILVVVIVITILLGRYALAEGHRIESQKKFMRDMEKFDNKKIKNEKK